jgi:hypothetical protein
MVIVFGLVQKTGVNVQIITELALTRLLFDGAGTVKRRICENLLFGRLGM